VTAAVRAPRPLALGLVVAATAAAGVIAWQGRSRLSGAVQVLPPDAVELRLDAEMEAEFGVQNPVVWVVAARGGSVWSAPVLAEVQALTRDVFRIPGVIPPDVISLASPNVRDFVVSEEIMEPVYLLARVPETDEEMTRLRRRVEGNPNYNGTLVSLDGRAAMIVADFRPGADPAVVARAALELRDRHRGEATEVHVAGGPVLAATVPRHLAPLAAGAGLVVLLGAVAALLALGPRRALGSALAALLAAFWSVAVLVALDAVVWPWTAYGLLPAMFVAAAFAASDRWPRVASSLLAAFAAVWLLAPSPQRAFAVAAGVGTLAAVAAAMASDRLLGASKHAGDQLALVAQPPSRSGLPAVAAILVVAAGVGLIHLRMSFGLFGYGVRYLPSGAAADLRAIGRSFPPPTALAVRFRGAPGFVTSTEALQSLDAVSAAVRDDPAVVRALSLADLIKIVNRAFHEDRPELEVIPTEPGMIGRYLALAYSPGFRRFIDRAFSRSALWVYLGSDDPADLERVRGKLMKQLASRPVPGAEVDLFGGDGAVAWRTAEVARRFALAILAGLAVFVLALAPAGGLRLGIRGLIGWVSATAFLAGCMGWTGIPIDLLSLPLLVTAAFAAGTFAALRGSRPLAYALALPGSAALVIAVATGNLLAALLGQFLVAPAVGAALSNALPNAGREVSSARRERARP
jgi:predicted RND superfamily exporter protein